MDMAEQKTANIIRGPANSGKTTLAHEIIKKIRENPDRSTMLISQDYIRHEMLCVDIQDKVSASIDLFGYFVSFNCFLYKFQCWENTNLCEYKNL